jgi:hypothetical protein
MEETKHMRGESHYNKGENKRDRKRTKKKNNCEKYSELREELEERIKLTRELAERIRNLSVIMDMDTEELDRSIEQMDGWLARFNKYERREWDAIWEDYRKQWDEIIGIYPPAIGQMRPVRRANTKSRGQVAILTCFSYVDLLITVCLHCSLPIYTLLELTGYTATYPRHNSLAGEIGALERRKRVQSGIFLH